MTHQPISLQQFQLRFSTPEACQNHLFRIRWPEGYKCPRCGHGSYYFHRPRHLYECKSCRYQVSLTAGTIFHNTRTPLNKWFWAIFLMARPKSGVSMSSLQRMLDIKSYKTIWMMGHKIRKAMSDRDSNTRLAALPEMSALSAMKDRSQQKDQGTAGRRSQIVVAVEDRGAKGRFAKMLRIESGESPCIHKAPKDNPRGKPVGQAAPGAGKSFTQKAPKVAREYLVIEAGKKQPQPLNWIHATIANLKANLKGVCKGVSDKHLQRYLDEFCFRFNRRYWESRLFEHTLYACLRTKTVAYSELKVYPLF